MKINLLLSVELDDEAYATEKGIPVEEASETLATEFDFLNDSLTWNVLCTEVLLPRKSHYSDVVKTILARPKTGEGGGIPLTRGEVAMLFLDGYAPALLDIRSRGYGENSDWDGLIHDDALEDSDTAFIWSKWEPFELWP